MNAIPIALDAPPLSPRPEQPIQTYARITGLLLVLSMVFGFLGEWYIPSQFMSRDATATAQKILSSQLLYRFGFAAYLVEAICDIGLALLFYVILKPVSRPLALAAAFFGLVSTALYAVAEIFYFAPTVLLSGAPYMKAFSPEQVNALTMVSLRLFGRVGMMFLALYGIASILRGYLIFRSRYLPKVVGILLMLGGVGFVAKNVTIVLAPAYSSDLFLAAMFPAGLLLTFWMLVKGVDVATWKAACDVRRDAPFAG
jgi:hypothetical protein